MIHLSTLLAESKLKLNIPSDIKKIYKLFKKNGKQLYVVGGAVRDAILGKRPKDFDLATDAKPDEVLAIAKKGGFKTAEVGKQFGVVIVGGHEIATFRKDIGKGRRPDAVDFTDIKGDVKRRDLTINALFYDMDKKQIVDLVGGIADLKKKKIKKSFEDNVNNPKITKFMSKYGYNELLVYDVKVKDAYIVIDAVGDPNDFEATDKALDDIKKDLKPVVKGKIFTGFVGGVKKFIKQRGGKV